MVPTAVPTSAAQPVDLAEWLKLRRPPPPDFVTSLDRLPPSLSPLVAAALPPGRSLDGALVMPAEYHARPASRWEFAAERALVFLGPTALLACAAAPDKPAGVTMLDAAGLLYVRSTLILLYGLLEFRTAYAGQAGDVRLEYNSVIWQTYRPVLARFIMAANGSYAAAGEQTARANAAILKTLPYKFANGLQYDGLCPGERLLAAVLQGEIRERGVIRSRQVTPPTVLALTDRKVILIEETLSQALHAQPKGEVGWAFTYIPRNRVAGMDVTDDGRRAKLTLRLEWAGAQDARALVLDAGVAAGFRRAWQTA